MNEHRGALPRATAAAAPGMPGANVTSVIELRRGLVYDKWPFRLDIHTEYQDWILVGMSFVLLFFWCMPCLCGRLKNSCSRSFTSWVYTRLHVFFCVITYVNLVILMFTLGVLPDWTVNEYWLYLLYFIAWVLEHLKKVVISAAIIMAFMLLFKFRERIAVAAGIEHVTVFRFSWRDLFGIPTKQRPVEVYIWKVEDVMSSTGKVMKPNDLYIECHMGYNEPMRTRVHNNAGSSCLVKESFQLNIDESASGTLMTLLVKDQALVTSTEVARLMLSTREVCGIEDQTGKRRVDFTYSEDCFVSLSLLPVGRIWLAIAPVEEGDEEKAPLIGTEDSLVTC